VSGGIDGFPRCRSGSALTAPPLKERVGIYTRYLLTVFKALARQADNYRRGKGMIPDGKPVKILVVDDSAFMRKAISLMLESDPGIKVIGTAKDGEESIAKVIELKPDLVTMDIEMPRMDGLTALKRIMEVAPLPVLMVSSLTAEGAKATLDALELGAVDFIPKQLSYVPLDIAKIKDDLLKKIKAIAGAALPRRLGRGVANSKPPLMTSSRPELRRKAHIVAIGTSTGGPPTLQAIIPKLPEDFPVGVLIVQHMPPGFTKSLAERLNGLSRITVKEAEEGDEIARGLTLIAPGDKHLTVRREGTKIWAHLSDFPQGLSFKPSVDVMASSVADVYGAASLGVILTGMGSDGLEGLGKIKEKGGMVIAQDEETSIIYGMPKAVVEAGIADRVTPLGSIASQIVKMVR